MLVDWRTTTWGANFWLVRHFRRFGNTRSHFSFNFSSSQLHDNQIRSSLQPESTYIHRSLSLFLYGTFVLVQTVKHRDYFLPVEAETDETVHAKPPSKNTAILSALFLLACLGSVVLLAKELSPMLETMVADMDATKTSVGIVIAAVVLLPESIAAFQAARANRLQTSLNLALGSALASIGLTIPAVALVSLINGWNLTLGIDAKSTVLLLLSLLVASFSLGTGRTTIMQGTVHLVIFAVYLFMAVVP